MEFAHPLSLGIEGNQEILGIEMHEKPSMNDSGVLEKLNQFLPAGFAVNEVRYYPLQQDKNTKKTTLMGRNNFV